MTSYVLTIAAISFVFGATLSFIGPQIRLFMRPRGDLAAIQCSHVGNPLRLGGFAIIGSVVFMMLFYVPNDAQGHEILLVVSVIPVFLFGLLEDFGYHVSPRTRFLAAVASAAIAVIVLDAWVSRLDLFFLDSLMLAAPVSIIFSVIFSAGFCHAVNLIDGMNGLAVVTIVTSALGCAAISEVALLPAVSDFSILLAAASVGFLVLNWPIARLFLGDAGAYGLGHLLVWQLFLLTKFSSDVAIPALALVIFWPLADVVHTILRRMARKVSILEPDKMHLHQKIRRALDIIWFGSRGRTLSNPLATLLLLPFIIAPVASGVILWNSPRLAWLVLVAFFLAFTAAHPLTVWVARRYRKSPLQMQFPC